MIGKYRTSRDTPSYFAAFARWFWLIALCTAIAAAGTFIVTKLQQPVYRATAVLLIDQQNALYPNAGNDLATTYAQLITQPVVLQTAAREVGGISPTELSRRVQVAAVSNTGLIDINVDDTTPRRAAVLANAVADAFVTTLNQQGLTDKYPVIIFQPAIPPSVPDHPTPIRDTLIGGVLGFAIAVALTHLLIWLDTRPPTVGRAGGQSDQAITDKRHVASH